MKRRLLAALLVAVMLVLALPLYLIPVSAADTFIEKDYSDVVQAEDTSGSAYTAGPATTAASASQRVKMTVSKITEDGKNISRAKFTRSSGSNKLVGLCFSFPEGTVATDDAKYITIQYRYTHATSSTSGWTGIAGTKMVLRLVLSDGTTKQFTSNENVLEGEWSTVTFNCSSLTDGVTISRVRLYFLGTTGITIYTDKYTLSSGTTMDVGSVYYSATAYYTGETEEPEVIKYNVTAVADGVTVDTAEVEEGANYTLPAAPAKDGYTFTGWSDGANTYAAGAQIAITADTTFTAVYELINVTKYTVTVVSDGATIASAEVAEGANYTLPAATSKDGYNFKGWSDGTTTYAAGAQVTITCETTFTAVFEAKVYYNVTVVSDGETVDTASVEENTKYTLPAATEKEGYKFIAWTDGENTYDANTQVTIVGATTFTAVFQEKLPPVKYGSFIVKDYADSMGFYTSDTSRFGVTKGKSTLASGKETYKITLNKLSQGKGVTANFTINTEGDVPADEAKYVTVQYRYVRNESNTFYCDGTTMTLDVTLRDGTLIRVYSTSGIVSNQWAVAKFNLSDKTDSTADIVSMKFYFGRYTGAAFTTIKEEETGMVGSRLCMHVGDSFELGTFFFSANDEEKYKDTINASFYEDALKVTLIEQVSSVIGEITVPEAPAKDGYTFNGWTDGEGNPYEVGTTILLNRDIDIFANYRPDGAADNEFRVSFNFAGGEAEAIEPYYASSAVMPAGPTKLGYTFVGWTDGVNTYAEGDTVEILKDTVFTATYVETYYTVTIVSDGETIAEESVREGAIFKLPAPAVKVGYTFVGWSDGNDTYSSGEELVIVGNTTFTAIFQEGEIDREVKAETIRALDNSYKNPMKLTDGSFSGGSGGYLTVSSSNTGAMTAFVDANGKQGVTIKKGSGGTAAVFNVPSSSTYPQKSLISFDLYFNELPTYEDGKVGIFSDRERNTTWAYSVDTSWLQIWTDENGKSWIGMATCDTPKEITTGKWYTAAFYIPGTSSNLKTEKLNGWIKAEDDHTYRAIGTLTNCSFVGNSNRATFAFVRNNVIDFTVSDFVMTLKSDTNFVKLDGVQFSKVENGVYSIRFVAALDGLATGETKIGFDVACESQGKSWNRETDKVYKSILANYGHDKISAEDLGASYITTLALNNIPASVGELEFVCTPYVIINNVKFYGTTVTVKCVPEGSNYSFAVVEATGETILPVTVEGGKVTMKKTIDGVEETEVLEPGTHNLVLTNDEEITSHTYDFKISGAGICSFGTPQTNGRVVKKDGIIVEFDARSEGKHASFTVYLPTSDPSGKYYIGYNIMYQSVTNVSAGNAAANSNLYRVYGAGLYYVTYWDGVTLKATNKLEVLQEGEISLALLEYYDGEYTNKADDYIGGLHGDERLLDPDKAKLYLDGVEVDLDAAMSHKYVSCSYITFTQETTMYRCGSATTSSYGTAVATHNQYFRIDEDGFRNDQSITWLVDDFHVRENFMQMFTMKRLDGYWSSESGEQTYYYTDPVCESFRVYDGSGNVLHEQTMLTTGNYQDRQQVCVNTKNRRIDYWSSVSGVSAYAGFTLPNDNVYVNNAYVFLREDYSKGDNKWYVSVKSRTSGDNPEIGEVWSISNYYGIDYDSRTIVK